MCHLWGMGSRCGLAERIGFKALILKLNAPVNLVFITIFAGAFFFVLLPHRLLEKSNDRKSEPMKEMDWAEGWLNKRKGNVRHLRTMIDKTRLDRENDSLIEARKGMTKILAKKYDVNSVAANLICP